MGGWISDGLWLVGFNNYGCLRCCEGVGYL